MFNWLRRKKDKTTPEIKASLTYGAIMGDSHRPVTETETMDRLGINIHTIEDYIIIATIDDMIKLASKQNPGQLEFHLYTLRNLLSKLIRCSRLEKIDAFILLKKTKLILRRIKMSLSQDLIRMGALEYIDSVEVVIWTAINDAVGGWKGKLLKVSPKQFEIAMRESKTKEPMI